MQRKESKEWEEKASTGNWFLSEKKETDDQKNSLISQFDQIFSDAVLIPPDATPSSEILSSFF